MKKRRWLFGVALLWLVLAVACQARLPSGTTPATPSRDTPLTRRPGTAPSEAVPVTPSPTTPPRARFDGSQALSFAQAQCAIGPRPTGSDALLRTREWIEQQVTPFGWRVVRQDFTYRGVPVHNVVAVKGEGRPVLVGAHYDTRPRADRDPTSPEKPIVGGSDGASGVAVLVELARVLDVPDGLQVQLAFFDAEDRGNIEGWPFSVGALEMAARPPVARPGAVVVVDMVGDKDQQIYRERNSDPALTDVLFAIAAELGYEGNGFYNEPRWTIIDDHVPFRQAGIPAALLIDFDYPAWHTLADTCDQLGAASLERVGRVVEAWIERGAPLSLSQ